MAPGYEIKIVDPQTNEEIKEPNKQGILYVRGYSNALLIMRNPGYKPSEELINDIREFLRAE